MLRDLIINGAKPAQTQYKAKAALKTGMAVKKADETFVEAAANAENVYFVQKERIPEGVLAGYPGNLSDYTEEFNEVKANEFVKIVKYAPGERFATSEYDTAAFKENTAVDTGVSFTAGKAVKATGTSIYLFKGIFDDAGHKLALIEVSDTAK